MYSSHNNHFNLALWTGTLASPLRVHLNTEVDNVLHSRFQQGIRTSFE